MNLDRYRTAKLLAENPPHQLQKRLACFVQNKSCSRIRPRQFKAGGQRGNPNLAHRSVWADDESSFVRVLELNFEFSATALDFKAVGIARVLQSLAQNFKRGVTSFLKFVFIHGRNRVPRSTRAGKEERT